MNNCLTYKYRVAVSNEDCSRVAHWTVKANSPEDAIQIAFALDGGWTRTNFNAVGLLELAKAYCEIKPLK